MDQVKNGSKTLLDFFQASSTEICKSNKELDSPTPAPSTNKTRQTQRNKEKMTFNPQWL